MDAYESKKVFPFSSLSLSLSLFDMEMYEGRFCRANGHKGADVSIVIHFIHLQHGWFNWVGKI